MTTPFVGNWISETCITVGTGDLTLNGAIEDYNASFQDAVTPGTVYYVIKSGDDRETGIGTLSGNTITRGAQATLVNGVYDDNNPTPLALGGSSVVECTTNADIFSKMIGHLSYTGNPHVVTQEQVGLGNVDNTSDANKPVSDATQTALDNKEDSFAKNTAFNKNFGTLTDTVAVGNHNHSGVYEPADPNIQTHISSTTNPHSVTAEQLTLGNVDNTADIDKPISADTQTALDLKANKNNAALTGVPTAPTAAPATNTTQIATTAFVLANGGDGGSSDHNELTNRDAADQHPVSAVTGLQTALDGKEPANANIQTHISATNNPHQVTQGQVGLSNVNNTSDANKPISTATQTALNLKANINSPTLTGVPKAPTATLGTNTTQLATTEFVQANKTTNHADLTNRDATDQHPIAAITDLQTELNSKASSTQEFVAFGDIGAGRAVYMRSDGLVEQVGYASAELSDSSRLVTAATYAFASAYHVGSGKLVIFYTRATATIAAKVGTISGNTITFGNEFIFTSDGTSATMSAAYYPPDDKIIFDDGKNRVYVCDVLGTDLTAGVANGVTYQASPTLAYDPNVGDIALACAATGGNRGAVYHLSVSGDTVSQSAPMWFGAVGTTSNEILAVFDDTANRLIITHINNPPLRYKAIAMEAIGFGTALFGSEVELSADIGYSPKGLAFDSYAGAVISFYNTVATPTGQARTLTTSGSTITMGPEVEFNASDSRDMDAAYDPTLGSTTLIYSDSGNLDYGTLMPVNIVAGLLEFGAPLVYNSGDNDGKAITSYQTGVCLTYSNSVASDYGDSNLYYSINTGSFESLGFNTEAVLDGVTAKISTVGSTNEHQSGLVTGLVYYIDDLGRLTLTVTDKRAGRAISPTEIIVGSL